MYQFLADLIVLLHLAYATFVVLALLVVLVGSYFGWAWVRNFWFRTVHLLLMGIVAAETVLGITCPLTVWEKQLRDLAGQTTYTGSFLGNLAHGALFIEAPDWVFGVAYLLFFVAVVAALVVSHPRWPWTGRVHGDRR